jgi:hypothetical protein
MIIGLSGYAGVGKDTAGSILVEGFGFERIAFADSLKKLAAMTNPEVAEAVDQAGGSWDRAKQQPFVREYLQVLGASARVALFGDVWIQAAFAGVKAGSNYVVTDVRFRNEADAIRQFDRSAVVRIVRPGVGAINDHVSEHQLDDYKFDAVIANDSTVEVLFDKLAAMLVGLA